MKRMATTVAALAVAYGMMGHNLPPVPVTDPYAQTMQKETEAIRRRDNKKLWQKRRKPKDSPSYHKAPRSVRKSKQHGPGYHPGKLFKGHRI